MLDLLQRALSATPYAWEQDDVVLNGFRAQVPLAVHGQALGNTLTVAVGDCLPNSEDGEPWKPRLELRLRTERLRIANLDDLVELCNNWNTLANAPKLWFEEDSGGVALNLSTYNYLLASKFFLLGEGILDKDMIATMVLVINTFIDDVTWFAEMNQREIADMLAEPPLRETTA